MYSTNLLPLCVPLPPCVGFVRKKGMNNWEGQQAAVWVGQICRHGVPPSLPACLHISLNSFVRAVRRWGWRWHEAEQIKSRDARRAHSTSEINENGLALPKIERPAQKVAANIGARLLCFMINNFDCRCDLLQFLWRSCYISLAIKSNTLGDWLTKLTFPLAF